MYDIIMMESYLLSGNFWGSLVVSISNASTTDSCEWKSQKYAAFDQGITHYIQEVIQAPDLSEFNFALNNNVYK